MNVLVIGSGGREHAICWTLDQAPSVEKVYCAPGNAGISQHAECVAIGQSDQPALIQFAKENQIALTIVGPEQPLSEGIVDAFQKEGLAIFGPTQKAAIIEGSKSFAKDLMKKYNVPTAGYEVFTDAEEAKTYIKEQGAPIVIKADGLAAGKGVVVAMTEEEALSAVEDMLVHGQFGSSSRQIVVEEFLEGEEFSFMSLVHHDTILPLEMAQDHKRAFDGDQGPNTGGMGAYSPVLQMTKEITAQALETIVKPVVDAMIQEDRSFTGVLYAGLILTENGPKVIEFNARFGDPETQVVLPRLKSDFAQAVISLLNGEASSLEWSDQHVVGVVLAANGYPRDYDKYIPLDSFEETRDDTLIFHAGTERKENKLVSNGGRVLLAAAQGNTVKEAQQKVYESLTGYNTEGLFYRSDIAHRAIYIKE
ncbi:phosphoribosylamine--glycine ligase [Jeotgalibacillus soli]|uniref:Phosphoribosylamine--glycine ligase n=1 Tax=Jeotgalibacillus soli TaxID=889306 RepID=A0A0C2VH04_9BACL|nr:phosphoribosylamine--glycine ligase [Jeotgalibacillus soli]KIL48157.1 phosphoribosylamine--glycine ligase [Jeotgalibacillus soli]